MSHTQLTLKQRFQVETFLTEGWRQKEIALRISVDPGTISRELSRYRGETYDARKAHAQSRERRRTAKQQTKKLLVDPDLYAHVEEKLQDHWSPEQISGRRNQSGEGGICHETIYRFIYEEKPGWKGYLRQKKGRYRRRSGTKKREREREETKKRRIDQREPIVETRGRIGNWEGDTIVGGEKTTGILTHVERKSGYLLADLLKHKSASLVRDKTTERFAHLSEDKKKTLTYDNGTEFSEYDLIEERTGMTLYFAYPYHSWERGTNENTNGLLRQFFPKRSLFATLTQKAVDDVVHLINHRPRKRLGCRYLFSG